jgi:hypothetical protein
MTSSSLVSLPTTYQRRKVSVHSIDEEEDGETYLVSEGGHGPELVLSFVLVVGDREIGDPLKIDVIYFDLRDGRL